MTFQYAWESCVSLAICFFFKLRALNKQQLSNPCDLTGTAVTAGENIAAESSAASKCPLSC